MRDVAGSKNSFTRLPRLLLTCPVAFSCLNLNIYHAFFRNQCRPFLKPSGLDGLFATNTPLRQLTHTRVIPYPRSTVFNAIASVDKYPSFLPFVLSATISKRDQNKRPTRASLKVGYDALGIEENWASVVNADEEHGIIEARSADTGQGNEAGLFEVLKTKWQLRDLEDIRRQGVGIGAQTAVRLDVEVKFRSAMYDKLFAGVEQKVAGTMVGAFEKRIKEVAGS
jgi:coenzyme Q-binding protein COQ10